MRLHGLILKYRSHRCWLGCVLLVAFFCKAIVPTGYMPEFSSSNHIFKIVICTQNGIKVVDADQDGSPSTDGPKTNAHKPCAMGGLAALILPTHEDFTEFRRFERQNAGAGTFSLYPSVRLSRAHASRAPPFLI